jgi:SHS family lactate transporter-like MFS transporter
MGRNQVSTAEATRVVIAGFLGWTLDSFDFFLVVIALPRIAADFNVKPAAIAGSLTLTLVFRPVGAFFFGLMADRYGRRLPMMLALLFYSTVEAATAFAPNLTIFMVLRALFGIGMGGEWGVGTSLVMEKVPARLRGILSGFLQEGYAVGYLLSAVAAYFLLDRFGWRPLFLLGGLPALLALFIRWGVKESKIWESTRAESWAHLGSEIARHWKLWVYLTLLMAAMNLSSHGSQDIYPTFLQSYRGLPPTVYSKVVIVMMCGAILGGIGFGLASDRFGRRKVIIVALAGALLVIPIWAFSSEMGRILVGAFFMQLMVQGSWGVIPAHISELAPDRVRGFLPGFAYQCGNLLAAWIGWAQATASERIPYPVVMGSSMAIIIVLTITITAYGRERRGVIFGGDIRA